MRKEKSSFPDSSEAPPADVARKHRAARSRSGKPAKFAKTAHQAPEEQVAEKSSPPYPVFDLAEPVSTNESSKSSGSSEVSPQENAKRKRRRKKGKGGGSHNAAQSALAEATLEPVEEVTAGESDATGASPRTVQKTRLKLDPEGVAKLAWKIYLAEVSEEGVALIGDSDAKELSRRCFRLAEIFIEEQAHRR